VKDVKVGAGVGMWWTEQSRADESRVRPAAVYKLRDRWRAFRRLLGTIRVEVYNVEICAHGLPLYKLVKKNDTLQTDREMNVADFSNLQGTIRHKKLLQCAPGQRLGR
jgi:hypothetical protein